MSVVTDPKTSSEKKSVTVLAIASAGGHWQQLMQITDAFSEAELVLASTNPELGKLYGFDNVLKLDDCNRDNIRKLLVGLWQTFNVVRRVKPDVIVSTGAAPGLLCLLWGRILGARTIWIDSVANSQQLSMSGRLAVKFCHVVLTQWKHLEGNGRPRYQGAVL